MSFKKNTAVTGFPFTLIATADGSAITTGTPVGYVTLDGGTQTAIGDVTPVHEGNGQWTFDLTAAEMNGDTVGFLVTHASAINAHFIIPTDIKLVSELNDIAAGAAMTLTATATSAQLVDDVWDEALSGHNIGGTTGKAIKQLQEGTVSAESTVNDASATTTSFITALTEATDNHYKDVSLVFIDGTLWGQSRPVIGYNGTTKTITLEEALTSAPANGDGFIIKTDHVHPVSDIQAGLALEAKQDTIITDIAAVKVDTASGGIPKNAIFNDFEFPMVLTSDHYTAALSKTVTGEKSIDGGAFVAVTGAIAEIGSGVYQCDLSAADTNGDTITYKFSATACDDTIITVTTRS